MVKGFRVQVGVHDQGHFFLIDYGSMSRDAGLQASSLDLHGLGLHASGLVLV